MKAVLQDQAGDESTLFVGEVPIPTAGDGELVIRVQCTALNRMDLLQCKGLYPVPPGASTILGVEVAGYVHAVGANCSGRFNVGDRCMALLQGGGYAEYAVAYECTTMKAPDELSMQVLASIPENWMTAYQLLFEVAHLEEGENVVLHAAASGVGQAAIQLVRNAKAHCIATCRSDDKVTCCLTMGANEAFNIKSSASAFSTVIRNAGVSTGADIILDPVGASYASENLELLNRDGRWVLYGLMGGPVIDDAKFLGKILSKRISLTGSTLRSRPKDYKARLALAMERDVVPKFLSGAYRVNVDATYPMTTEGVREAHRRMATNENIGKIVLVVSAEEGGR